MPRSPKCLQSCTDFFIESHWPINSPVSILLKYLVSYDQEFRKWWKGIIFHNSGGALFYRSPHLASLDTGFLTYDLESAK
jgi:hypothetical protein